MVIHSNNNISFIVIGKNEGWKLSKCFESIYRTVEYNKLHRYEIIYVDSDSADNSIEIASGYKDIRVFKIIGDVNAAIGRNVGAKESNGDVLFFIDGDMELVPNFLQLVYNEKDGLLYEFVSGKFENYNYSLDNVLLSKEIYNGESAEDSIEFTVGGLFFIKRELWVKLNGMKEKFRRSQDIDLAIRLAKGKVFLLRKKEILAIHHTYPYHNIQRVWKDMINCNECFRSVLLRENITNHYQWKLFFRENYSSIFLILCLMLMFFNLQFAIFVYFLFPLLRSIKRDNTSMFEKFNLFFYFIIRDIVTWLGLLFFWPVNHKKFTVSKIST